SSGKSCGYWLFTHRLSMKSWYRIGSSTGASRKLIGSDVILAVGLLSLLMLSFSFVPVAKADPTNVTTIPLGYITRGVAYDAGKGEVFATNQGSNTVSVISDITLNLVAKINVGIQHDGVAYDSGKGEVCVT